jgi:Fe-S oxidoreductase
VLQAAGYVVHVAGPRPDDEDPDRPLCCGRTYLSAGLVDEARAEAQRTLRGLAPFLERGAAVVGLEPSCLFTMRDEFLALKLGAASEAAAALAERALMLEEFLDRESKAGRLDWSLQPIPGGQVLLHGHCHQKAFDAMRPVERVLRLVPDLQVSPVESSCCGMAGAFGFEAEHFDASMAMAELSLLPAVRSSPPEALIVADGTSCRHQIADGTGRRALHVAEVLAMALRR